MAKEKKKIQRCDRCKRRQRNNSQWGDWVVMVKQGIPVEFVCPDCLTDEENAMVAFGEATLDVRVFPDGVIRERTKTSITTS
jgi:hypothetical protein